METLKSVFIFGVKVFFALILFMTHVSAGVIIDGEAIEPDSAELAYEILKHQSLYRHFGRDYCPKFLRAKIEEVEPPHNEKNTFCIDRFSRIHPPKEVEELKKTRKGSYFGFGISLIESDSGEVTVVDFVSEDSPARGIMSVGDIILSIRRVDDVEGEGRQSITSTEDLGAYINKEGKVPLVVTVFREGFPIELPPITPSDIVYPNVTYKKFGATGYIDIRTFNNKTSQQFLDALREVSPDEDPADLIFDLRDNGGGTVKSVTWMLGLFSKPGDIIIKQFWFGGASSLIAGKGPLVGKYLNNKRIIVLINNNSASASEIFAGVMKDRSNGENILIVGTTSYGKGVIQSTFSLPRNFMFRLTTDEYLVGNSMTMIHGVGVTPDYCVKDTRGKGGENDVQLLYALMLIDNKGSLPEKNIGKKCSE